METENFQFIDDFDAKKSALQSFLVEKMGELPAGVDEDVFVDAVLKIQGFLENLCQGEKIGIGYIPDGKNFKFGVEKGEISVSNFVLNRIVKNVKSFKISHSKDKSDGNMGGGYNKLQKNIVIHPDHVFKLAKPSFVYYKHLFNSEEDFKRLLFSHICIHELFHAICDSSNVNLKQAHAPLSDEGFVDYLAGAISGLNKCQAFRQLNIKSDTSKFFIRTTPTGYSMEKPLIMTILKTVKDPKKVVLSYLLNEKVLSDKTFWMGFFAVNKVFKDIQTNSRHQILPEEFIHDYIDTQKQLISVFYADKVILQQMNFILNGYNAKDFNKLAKDINSIGLSLVFELPKNKNFDEKEIGLALSDSEKLGKLISTKKIVETENVSAYKDLIEKFGELKNNIEK